MYRNLLEKLARTRLDDVLLDEGLMDRATAEEVLAEQQASGRALSEILFDRQAIDEWSLAKIVAAHYGLPFVDVVTYDIPREAQDLLSIDTCRDMHVLPMDVFGDSATFAVIEMPQAHQLAESERLSGKAPFLYVAARRPMLDVLDQWEKAEKKKQARSGKHAVQKAARAAAKQAAVKSEAAEPVVAGPVAASVTASDPELEPEVNVPVAVAAGGSRRGGDVLGELPSAVLALGSAPTGFGVDVASAGVLGRVARRTPTKRTLDLGAPSAAPTAAPPVEGAPQGGGWESIFDEGDGRTGDA